MTIALNGTTGYLSLAQKIATAYPFTMALWVAGSTSVSSQAAILQGTSTASRYCMGWFTNFGADKNASAASVANGSAAAVKSTTPHINASTLQVMMVVFQSATSRKVYFGSNVESIDTASIADEVSSHNQVIIGAYQANSGAPTFFLTGSVAEAAIFNRACDDADYDSLVAGTLANTLSGCLACFPLQTATDLTSTNGTYTLTANGGVTTSGIAHPVTRGGGGGGVKNSLNFFRRLGNGNL